MKNTVPASNIFDGILGFELNRFGHIRIFYEKKGVAG
jgi:hypothetical protein